MPPPPPPHQIHITPQTTTTTLPDLFLTALSILFFFSSTTTLTSFPKPHFPKLPFLSFPSSPRRFLKIPSMSVSRKMNNSHYFSTPQSLSDWLKPRLPSDSFASWGIKPGTKNIHNLWLEISQGETFLADSTPPIRTVNVVTVKVINKNQTLIESHQELSDGSVRNRCRPLSEKMKPNESLKDAIFRAINEELGSILKDGNEVSINIVNGSYKEKVEERNSMSYPGLPARYVLYSADVEVNGLPDGEFCTEETEEYPDSEERRVAEKAVSVKKHFWKWVSSDSVHS
ncbi:hypothetical protein OIU77_008510 [Salix suchowensis]|uniref:Uncharacterized protein n=1 Tax=Salix suchowensis TaxID=1278906 RepID=A0ABQ9AL89_9ROSI|nr:RING-H2 zinc finger protein [Salix suchowensis]KAJ6340770.1 hypothetical protein OIU77_008510 [Salix suchowensis]KAJ6373477.1 hypothetical protein OIU78_029212 [Salix suchowensis]